MIAELHPQLVGRHLGQARAAGAHAVALELAGSRNRWLWLDAGRGTAGLYLVDRDVARRLLEALEPARGPAPGVLARRGPARGPAPGVLARWEPPAGRARQALLLIRKHLAGRRVQRVLRVPGERSVVLEAGEAVLVLRPGGAGPALTLAVGGSAVATLGEGPPAWPLPEEAPEREWDRVDPEAFAATVEAALAAGRSLVGAVLAACPGLGPLLARESDGSADSFRRLQARLASAAPAVVLPAAAERPDGGGAVAESPQARLAGCHDAELAEAGAVVLAPVPLASAAAGEPRRRAAGAAAGTVRLTLDSWLEAGALHLEGRQRGLAFDRARRAALDRLRRNLRRLEQLDANLEDDLASLEDEGQLRRRAEALLAFGQGLAPGASSAELPDTSDPAGRLLVRLDPRLGVPANAERLFDRARRCGRARRQIALRLAETRSALAEARAEEARALDSRDLADVQLSSPPIEAGSAGSGPRHYLTSRGLSILVGRGARENHRLTFQTARAEDLWLHARDVPGAHVVLRDNEGRASAEDLREAAELAAFFSEARGSGPVDVHVTRRKHVRPARGGPGRVFVAHSDTLRVRARDPEGRLRRR